MHHEDLQIYMSKNRIKITCYCKFCFSMPLLYIHIEIKISDKILYKKLGKVRADCKQKKAILYRRLTE